MPQKSANNFRHDGKAGISRQSNVEAVINLLHDDRDLEARKDYVEDHIRNIAARGLRVALHQLVPRHAADRKSTRLNSSHGYISYAVFCLKKKKKKRARTSVGNKESTNYESLSERLVFHTTLPIAYHYSLTKPPAVQRVVSSVSSVSAFEL